MEFTRKYFKSLKFLDALKENCFGQRKLFEKLKDSNGLCSIMLQGEKNIRILFAFTSNEWLLLGGSVMSINVELLKKPWGLINELADEKTKGLLELDELLIGISLKLINFRLSNNMSQKQLAEKLQISQSMISKLESGDYNPTVEQLWRLSKKLGWKFELLLENDDTETNVWNTNEQIEVLVIEEKLVGIIG